MGIVRVTIWVIGVTNLLTKSPRPSKLAAFVLIEGDICKKKKYWIGIE